MTQKRNNSTTQEHAFQKQCDRCHGSKWRTLVKGRSWWCRYCGTVRSIGTSEATEDAGTMEVEEVKMMV